MIVSLPDYGHVIAFAPTRLFQVKLARAELPAHGAVVNCRVVAASAPRVIVALDLSELAAASPSSSSWATKAPSVGASVTGTISDITGILARVKLDGFNNAARGRLWIGHVTNDENGSPMASLAVGQTIKGIVADVNGSKDGKRTVDVHVSLVPSPSIVTLSDLSVGKTVSAFVQRVQRDFIWVSLSPELRARVPSLLACNDAAACSDLASRFKIGQRVQGEGGAISNDSGSLSDCCSVVQQRLRRWMLTIRGWTYPLLGGWTPLRLACRPYVASSVSIWVLACLLRFVRTSSVVFRCLKSRTSSSRILWRRTPPARYDHC